MIEHARSTISVMRSYIAGATIASGPIRRRWFFLLLALVLLVAGILR